MPALAPPPPERYLLPTVLEATDALISIVDREGRIISFNRACEELSGYTFEEVRGRVFYEIFLPPEEAEQVRAVFARLGRQEPILRHENHWITKSGERRRIVWSNAIIRDSDGEVRHMVGTGIDITELRRTDMLLREAEADYRLLFKRASDAIVITDREGRLLQANEAACRMSGYPLEQLLRLRSSDLLAPEEFPSPNRNAVLEGRTVLNVRRVRRSDGSLFRVETSTTGLAEGRFLSIIRDISGRERAERELRESEARYRAVVEQASEGITVTDREWRFLDVNPSACAIFGYAREELLGRSVRELAAPGELEGHPLHERELAAGSVTRTQRRIRRKDGSILVVEIKANSLPSGDVVSVVSDVTERTRAEEALRESEARYHWVVEHGSDGVWITGQDLRMVEANDRACEMLGYTREELLGAHLHDLIDPENLARTPLRVAEVRAGRTVLTDRRLRRKDGSWFDAEISARMLPDGRYIGSIRDVTERRRADQALRESEARYRALTEQASDGIWMMDVRTRLLDANLRLCEMTGYAREEVLGRHVEEFLLAEDLAVQPVRPPQLGLTLLTERRIRRRDGSILEAEISSRRVTAERIVGVVRDVAERKRAERALRASEERFRRVVESDMIGIFFPHPDGRVLEANDYFLRVVGYRRRDLLDGRVRWDRMVASEDVRRNVAAVEEVRTRGSFAPVERELQRPDGTRVVVLVGGTQIEGEGAPYVCFLLDLTELRRAEQSLAEAQHYLSRAQELAHIGSWEANLETMTARFSDEMLRICGLPDDTGEIRYEEFLDLVHPEDRAMVNARIRDQIEHVAADHYENRVVRPDGGVRIVEAISEPVHDASGRLVRLIGSVQDVTERRFLERQLREAQKLEAIGRLAGGVAHDFNNLLTVILGYAETLLAGLEREGPRHDSADQIRQAGRRASALTQQLLAFARRQIFELQVFDLNAVIVGMREILGRLLGERIEVAITPGGTPCLVRADRGQIEQVILNLALNARDAMPEGGRLSIATYALRAASRCGQEGDQACVRLTVSDTGAGMSAEVQSHIFEPFFTTKQAGRGTGLGLATVHGIVAQSGGRIEVMSAPGRGSTFHVYLPAAEAAETPAESAPATGGHDGNETILLVEDEKSVRELAAGVLRVHGYRVVEAADAESALEVAGSLAPLDLLLTDIVMPGLNGRELAERLGRDRAGLRVLFVSGYSDEALAHQDAACRSGAFLEKPFAPEALLDKVREVLDQS